MANFLSHPIKTKLSRFRNWSGHSKECMFIIFIFNIYIKSEMPTMITVLYILIFMFFGSKWKDKRFLTQWQEQFCKLKYLISWWMQLWRFLVSLPNCHLFRVLLVTFTLCFCPANLAKRHKHTTKFPLHVSLHQSP